MFAARWVCAALGLLVLAACGGDAPPTQQDKEQAKEQAQALGRDTDSTVVDDMIQTQDRARAVEDLTLSHKDAIDQALEEAGDDSAAAK